VRLLAKLRLLHLTVLPLGERHLPELRELLNLVVPWLERWWQRRRRGARRQGGAVPDVEQEKKRAVALAPSPIAKAGGECWGVGAQPYCPGEVLAYVLDGGHRGGHLVLHCVLRREPELQTFHCEM
jgi:hypothetical protein